MTAPSIRNRNFIWLDGVKRSDGVEALKLADHAAKLAARNDEAAADDPFAGMREVGRGNVVDVKQQVNNVAERDRAVKPADKLFAARNRLAYTIRRRLFGRRHVASRPSPYRLTDRQCCGCGGLRNLKGIA